MNLSWHREINKMTSKAKSNLGFVHHNFHACDKKVKDAANKTLIQPHLEYESAV